MIDNIELMSTISFWISKITAEVKYQKNQLCCQKYKLLETEWTFWTKWFIDNVESLNDDEINIEKCETKILEEYKKLIDTKKTFRPLIKMYTEIHSILIEELLTEIKKIYQSNYTLNEKIYYLGYLLHKICVSNILEIKELTIDCRMLAQSNIEKEILSKCSHDPNCSLNSMDRNKITIFVTHAFNINSYAAKKVHKFIEIFNNQKDLSKISLTFDFTHYKETNKEFSSKIAKAILIAKRYFKETEVKNICDKTYEMIKSFMK